MVGFFKCDLKGHSSGSMEDSAESGLNYVGPDQEVSEGKKLVNSLEIILVLFW